MFNNALPFCKVHRSQGGNLCPKNRRILILDSHNSQKSLEVVMQARMLGWTFLHCPLILPMRSNPLAFHASRVSRVGFRVAPTYGALPTRAMLYTKQIQLIRCPSLVKSIDTHEHSRQFQERQHLASWHNQNDNNIALNVGKRHTRSKVLPILAFVLLLVGLEGGCTCSGHVECLHFLFLYPLFRYKTLAGCSCSLFSFTCIS